MLQADYSLSKVPRTMRIEFVLLKIDSILVWGKCLVRSFGETLIFNCRLEVNHNYCFTLFVLISIRMDNASNSSEEILEIEQNSASTSQPV